VADRQSRDDRPHAGGSVNGPLAVVNGVIFAGSMDSMGMMYALDATTGDVKWQFASGATVYSGPAIVNGVVYWELAIVRAPRPRLSGRRSSTRSTSELKSRDHPFTPQIRAPERPGRA